MRTPITYYGGKQTMLNDILPMITDHKIYCEPFFGGGSVFFGKSPSVLEVINDTNDRLITFYEVMRDNFDELNTKISDTLHSETLHAKAKDIYYGRIDASKLDLAWSVWVIMNMSFAGSTYGGWKWCNGTAGTHAAKVIRVKRDFFKKLKDRLRDVQISNKDALEVILKRDTVSTFFYLDPPYPGAHQGHYYGYTIDEFHRLLTVIQSIKGRFILSNYWSQTLKYFILKNNWKYKIITRQLRTKNFKEATFRNEILVWNFETENNLFSENYENPKSC